MTLLGLCDKVTAHPEGDGDMSLRSRGLSVVVAVARVWYKGVDTCGCSGTYALFKEVLVHAFTPESSRLSPHD